ncbi:hypothetical protein CYMTET_5691 [Cymbomonas tetramitiformis]|uniref:Uncharacterized protein n=1 Tax=Cymbomonas tetramitiformis TaxID=36881 RepID=A0AAE0GYX1_9CHLO|nr:hypothetical protein CYMTET_5691 [Cymbomonas tetramitiformis]
MVNDSNGQILIVPCRMDGESSEAAKTRRTKRVKKKVVAAPEPLYRSTASIKLEENEKTIKSFQNLNGKLAEELYHSRTSANTELISLREHLSRVEGELKSETERASSAIDRLASETQESQRRSRELERRTEGLQAELADERSLRNAAQAECASLAQQARPSSESIPRSAVSVRGAGGGCLCRAGALSLNKWAPCGLGWRDVACLWCLSGGCRLCTADLSLCAARCKERQRVVTYVWVFVNLRGVPSARLTLCFRFHFLIHTGSSCCARQMIRQGDREGLEQVAQLQEQQRTAERRMERDTEHLTGIREQVHKYEAMAAGEASKAQEQGARNASLQRSLQDKERSWEELQKKHASLEGVVRSLTERNSLLVDAHRILEAEVAGGREAHGLAVQKASEVKELQYRLDGMQQQLQEQSQRAHLALEASNSAQGSLQEKSEGMSKMGAELEATRKERQVAGEHLEHERARAQQLEQEVGCLRVELDVSRRELAILAQQFEEKQVNLHTAHENLRAAENGTSEARADLAVLQERSAALERDLCREVTRAQQLSEAKAVAEARSADVSVKLKEKEACTSVESRIMMDREMEMDALRRAAGAAADDAAGWREKYAASQAVLEERHKELTRMAAQHRDKVDELMTEHHRVSKQLGSCQLEVDGERARRQAAEDLGRELEEEARALRDETRRMHEANAQMEADLLASRNRERLAESARAAQALEASETAASLSALRSELLTIEERHAAQLEQKAGVVANVLAAMETEERAKVEAEEEVERMKGTVAEANTLVGKMKHFVLEAMEHQRQAEDDSATSKSTMDAMRKKNQMYRKENRALLTNYDRWLQHITEPAAAPGADPTAVPVAQSRLGARTPPRVFQSSPGLDIIRRVSPRASGFISGLDRGVGSLSKR